MSTVVKEIKKLPAIVLCFCSLSYGQPALERAPVELTVLSAPTPVPAESKIHLVYELHVTNFSENDLTLRQLQVFGGKSPAPIATYLGSKLGENIRTPGRSTSNPALLGGGQRLVFFIWITLGTSAALPAKLRHRLTFDGFDSDKHQVKMSVEGAATLVRHEKAILIRAPLVGGPWRAGGGPSNNSPHRRAVMAVDGKACDAQRFAVDWLKLGPNGRACQGDCSKNADYYSYGSGILAVADGRVAEVAEDIPENTPGSVRPHTFETGLGNHVVLELSAGHYAFYAHMQPGKMRVKVGDYVRAGQILGLVGNSGNAKGPHLHFHIMDGPSPLGSEGLPYVLDSFTVNGHTHTRQIPLSDMVVTFADY